MHTAPLAIKSRARPGSGARCKYVKSTWLPATSALGRLRLLHLDDHFRLREDSAASVTIVAPARRYASSSMPMPALRQSTDLMAVARYHARSGSRSGDVENRPFRYTDVHRHPCDQRAPAAIGPLLRVSILTGESWQSQAACAHFDGNRDRHDSR
jgi:hypothetical protein